jgi:fucose permease
MIAQNTAPINYRVVAISYITFIALGIPGGLLGVAWPSIRDTFEVSPAALGTLLFTGTLGYLLASMFSGRIVSRMGIGPALLAASGLSAVGLIGYAIAPSWVFIILIGVVLGVGQGVVDAGMNLYFANNFSPRLMNWLHACFGLGAAIGPLVMTGLLSLGQSWRWGYVIIALVQVALVAVFALTRDQWHARAVEISGASQKPNIPDFSIMQTLRHPPVLLGIALFFVFTGIESTAGNWTFTLFTESRGIDLVAAGQWVSFYWWSFTLGRLIFGVIANRIAVHKAILICMLLMVLGAVLLSLNLSDVISFGGLALLGFALAPIFPLLITATPERLGPGYATNAIGFQVGAASLGIAGLPALAGVLAAELSLEIIGPFLIGAAVLSLILYILTSRTGASTSAANTGQSTP